ncbi:MAG: metal ABC transporter ATP-binding protein [Syntrophobacteraceae bacterium]
MSFESASLRRLPVFLRDVRILLGSRVIQDEMTLRIEDGEFIAVLGPNGAGKTTFLKLLLGQVPYEAGEVLVFGAKPRRGNPKIGYSPQFRTLDANFAVRARDLVGFGLDGHRFGPGFPSRKRGKLIDQALEEVRATEYAEAAVGELSGGERQRLSLAQVLIANPGLVLLDEPLANLDIASAQEIIALVGRLCVSRKVAVMLVTHDINPLLPHVDRVLYMANGRSAIGRPENVITRETLSSLYNHPVDVVEAGGKKFVLGVEI